MHTARKKASLICRSELIVECQDVALLGKYNVGKSHTREDVSVASSPVSL